MEYVITPNNPFKINFAPKNLTEEVLQNIETILRIQKYEAPLCRNFGLSARFVDKPIQVAEALLISDVFDAIEQYEKRVEITGVSFLKDETAGKLIPQVKVKIIG